MKNKGSLPHSQKTATVLTTSQLHFISYEATSVGQILTVPAHIRLVTIHITELSNSPTKITFLKVALMQIYVLLANTSYVLASDKQSNTEGQFKMFKYTTVTSWIWWNLCNIKNPFIHFQDILSFLSFSEWYGKRSKSMRVS